LELQCQAGQAANYCLCITLNIRNECRYHAFAGQKFSKDMDNHETWGIEVEVYPQNEDHNSKWRHQDDAAGPNTSKCLQICLTTNSNVSEMAPTFELARTMM